MIDIHFHLGSFPTLEEGKRLLLDSIANHPFECALVSHLDATEFGEEDERVRLIDQMTALKEGLDFCKEHEGRFYLLAWIRPNFETPSKEFCDLIKKNLKYIKGLKMHPYCSRMRIDDPKVEPYLSLAEELHLPILVHTAIDDYSSILHLEAAAKKHPNLTFIAAHMELYTDHDCTIEVMKRNPNIYCDTAWVEMKDAARAIEEVGKERVLFGSDTPLDGKTTLDEAIYQNYFHNVENLDEESYALLMGGNAKRIFRI